MRWIALALVQLARPDDRATIYVSPDGDDAGTGRAPHAPLRSLPAARDAARRLRADGSLAPGARVTVRLGPGVPQRRVAVWTRSVAVTDVTVLARVR